MSKFIDLTGQVFNRLTVVSYAGKNKYRCSLWNCICVCGNEKVVHSSNLKRGWTQSCGCLFKEMIRTLNTKHGHHKSGYTSPTYVSWRIMVQRCTNFNYIQYKDYGGRGITVCDRWSDTDNGFINFLSDMGERPKGLVLSRININENYSPENCRWATRKECVNNRRNTIYLTYQGETKTKQEWANDWNIDSTLLHYHLKKGKTMEWIYENKVINKLDLRKLKQGAD